MQTHPVDVHWHSYELRPKGSPPMPAAFRERIEQGRPRLHQIALEVYGVKMNPGPYGMDSRPALIGAKFAEAEGKGVAYHDRILRAYWDEARPIDDLPTLATLAADAGLDRDAFLAALDDPRFAAEVDEDIRLAAIYGLNGVPALVFDNTYLVSGAQPPDVLRRIVDQIRGANPTTASAE